MHINSGEHAMAEFGDIFDYQICTTVFSYITIGFIGAYGLFGVWIAAQFRPMGHRLGGLAK